MKLTIKNYKKIIGHWGSYGITDVVEQEDYYAFSVTDNQTMQTREVHLRREGRVDGDGDTVFDFVNGNSPRQMVTADWFSNMKNAFNTIISEYQT